MATQNTLWNSIQVGWQGVHEGADYTLILIKKKIKEDNNITVRQQTFLMNHFKQSKNCLFILFY
jgi:hypothetical protein